MRPSNPTNGPSVHGGFTLIELLVVVAIIAVLAALLFAGAQRARLKTYELESASNLRQWGAAMALSLQDFGNRLPSDGDDGSSVVSEESAWFNRLPPRIEVASHRGREGGRGVEG